MSFPTFSWIKNEAAGAPAGADARHDACGPHFHESLAGGVGVGGFAQVVSQGSHVNLYLLNLYYTDDIYYMDVFTYLHHFYAFQSYTVKFFK